MIRRAGAAGLAVLLAVGAAAQQTAEPLSFEAAVRIALESNPQHQRQLNAIATAEYQARQSFGSAFLPSLNASIGANASTFRRVNAEDPFGNPLDTTVVVVNTTSGASQGLGGQVPLFNLQALRGYGAARAQTAREEAAASLGAAQLRTQVGQAYYQTIRSRSLVAVEERQLTGARERLEAIRGLFRVAARQPTDVLGAELQVAQAEQALQQARGGARKDALLLNQVLGTELAREFELTSPFPRVFDPSALDVARLIEEAAVEGPRLRIEEAALAAAEQGVSVARAARYPSLSGNYSWGRSTSAQDYAAFRQFDLPNQSWGFGFNVSVPLFNRMATSAQVGQAEVALRNAHESLREARLQVEREVRASVIDLENAHRGVELAERAAELARERYRQGQELYRLGTLDFTALQQMIDQVASAERGVVAAHHDFAMALLALEERVGHRVEVEP